MIDFPLFPAFLSYKDISSLTATSKEYAKSRPFDEPDRSPDHMGKEVYIISHCGSCSETFGKTSLSLWLTFTFEDFIEGQYDSLIDESGLRTFVDYASPLF